MKIVLRHKTTGRYYHGPGKWVRRADNALTFDALGPAQEYLQLHGMEDAQAVLRLAPYLMPLINAPKLKTKNWDIWLQARANKVYLNRANRFGQN